MIDVAAEKGRLKSEELQGEMLLARLLRLYDVSDAFLEEMGLSFLEFEKGLRRRALNMWLSGHNRVEGTVWKTALDPRHIWDPKGKLAEMVFDQLEPLPRRSHEKESEEKERRKQDLQRWLSWWKRWQLQTKLSPDQLRGEPRIVIKRTAQWLKDNLVAYTAGHLEKLEPGDLQMILALASVVDSQKLFGLQYNEDRWLLKLDPEVRSIDNVKSGSRQGKWVYNRHCGQRRNGVICLHEYDSQQRGGVGDNFIEVAGDLISLVERAEQISERGKGAEEAALSKENASKLLTLTFTHYEYNVRRILTLSILEKVLERGIGSHLELKVEPAKRER